jgi:hypothetical protein
MVFEILFALAMIVCLGLSLYIISLERKIEELNNRNYKTTKMVAEAHVEIYHQHKAIVDRDKVAVSLANLIHKLDSSEDSECLIETTTSQLMKDQIRQESKKDDNYINSCKFLDIEPESL